MTTDLSNRILEDLDKMEPTAQELLEQEPVEEIDEKELKALQKLPDVDDSVRMHLREIAAYPVFTPEEEREIFICYANATDPELKTELKHTITCSNLKLAVSIAKKYRGRGLDFGDLISLAEEGLMKSIDKFNVHSGNKFSTYSSWWIKQAILRGIDESVSIVRKPVHFLDEMRKFRKAISELTDKYDREPTQEEIADYLHISKNKLKDYHRLNIQCSSLDTPVGEENDSFLGDFIEDMNANVVDDVLRRAFHEQLRDLIDEVLNEREKFVIFARFGMNEYEQMTLEEVGKLLHVTRERIRQLEAKAIRKLRLHAGKAGLQHYLSA